MFGRFVALLMLGALGQLATAQDFLTAPYLQNVRQDGISIMWELEAETAARVVAEAPDGTAHTADATTRESGGETSVYKAVLRGLAPGTEYTYRVLVEEQQLGEARSFKTAPAGRPPFSFAVWADSQGSNAKANPENPLEPTIAMMAHMGQSGIDIAVSSGDLASDGAKYTDTRRYYLDRVAAGLGPAAVPWFNAWGNHDADRGASLRRFADMPSGERPGFTPGFGSFSFAYAGAHFVCIDYANAAEDIAGWLEEDLQAARAADPRHIFLFIHVPPYCELWIDGDAELRETLVPLAEQYGVEAIFSGHTHEYERGYLNGIHYIITGGGSWLDTHEPVVHDWPHMFIGGAQDMEGMRAGLINEYVRIDVGEDGWRGTVHAFESSGEYRGVIDTFGSDLADTDGDGFLDVQEAMLGSNPEQGDGDGDGVSDEDEAGS